MIVSRYQLVMHTALAELIDRLARLHLADRRDGDLNPAQVAALDYLARANRFSRMPSAVAEFLAATRGTVSQTLKSLARKGLVRESADAADRRVRRYDVTPAGYSALRGRRPAPGLPQGGDEAQAIEAALRRLIEATLRARGQRSFGLCRTCRHHAARDGAPYCGLLALKLQPEEADQICQEHAAA